MARRRAVQPLAVLLLALTALIALTLRPDQARAVTNNVTGTVYLDLNNNGVRDAGEPGISGITATAYGQPGAVVLGTATTAPDGTYTLIPTSAPAPGDTVEFTLLPGYQVATAVSANDNLSQPIAALGTTASLGLTAVAPTAAIGDLVWSDLNADNVRDAGEPGLAAISVQLLNAAGSTLLASAVTDSSGNYEFSSAAGTSTASSIFGVTTLAAGTSYVVKLPASGRTHSVAIPAAGGTINTIDFGIAPTVSTITAQAYSDTGGGANTGNGVFDAGEAGIAGVNVQLQNSAHTVIATAPTNATGAAHFTAEPIGNYTVVFAAGGPLAGLTVSTGSTAVAVTLTAAGATANAGFVGPFAVGAAVTPALAGVVVTLFGPDATTPATTIGGAVLAPVTTGSTGYYAFDGLAAGSYVAKFAAPTGYQLTSPGGGSVAFTVGTGAPNNAVTTSSDVSMTGAPLAAAMIDRSVTATLQAVAAPVAPVPTVTPTPAVARATSKSTARSSGRPAATPASVLAAPVTPAAAQPATAGPSPLDLEPSVTPTPTSAPTQSPSISAAQASSARGSGGAKLGGAKLGGGTRTQSGQSVQPISASLARPIDAFSSLSKVATSIAIAAATVLLLTFPSELFNVTLEENYDELRRDWGRLPTRMRRSFRRVTGRAASPVEHARAAIHETGRSMPVNSPLRRRGWFVIVVALGALCGELLNPNVGFNRSALDGYIAYVAVLLVEIFVPASIAMIYHRRRGKPLPHQVRALPGGLLIAAGCVFISRVAGFQPGYLYGIVAGVAFTGHVATRQKAHIGALTAVTVLVISVAGWFVWVQVDQFAVRPGAAMVLIILDNFFASLLVGGLVASVMRLLPLTVMPGGSIKRWHRGVWAGLLFLSIFGLVDILLLSQRRGAHHSSASLVLTALLFLFFIAAAIGLREYCVLRLRAAAGHRPRGWQENLRALSSPVRKADRPTALAHPAPH